MSALENYYSGPYYFDNTDNIYVHLHMKNIGMAGKGESEGGTAVSSTDLVQIYKQEKQKALTASKQQFTSLFLNSLNKDSAILLNQLLNTNEDIMTQLSNQMGQKLQEVLSTDKMAQLMSMERYVTSTDFIRKILNNNKDSFNAFNDLLQSLNKSYNLLKTTGKDGVAFSSILSVNSIQDMGQYLLDAINNFKKNNQKVRMSKVQIERANNIIQQINALGKNLKTGTTGGEGTLTVKTVRKLIENVFNTGFAESLSSIIKSEAYKELKEKGLDETLTGNKQVKIQYSDQFGKLTNMGGSASSGKADVKFNNMSFEININGEKKEIMIDLGISDKFYKTNYFPGLDSSSKSNENQFYSSGSGGSLSQALSALFGSNLRSLYLAYNTFAFGDKATMQAAQMALQDIVLTRQIVRLFSSRGGNQDFAQYIFANNQIIPIWDLIMKSVNDLSKSKSQLKEGSDQPISLHIEDRQGIYQAAKNTGKNINQAIRVKNINDAFNKAKIKAEINLKNI